MAAMHMSNSIKMARFSGDKMKIVLSRNEGDEWISNFKAFPNNYFTHRHTPNEMEQTGSGANQNSMITTRKYSRRKEKVEDNISDTLHSYRHKSFTKLSMSAVKKKVDCNPAASVTKNESEVLNSSIEHETVGKSSEGGSLEKTLVISICEADDVKSSEQCSVPLQRMSEECLLNHVGLGENFLYSDEESRLSEKPSKSRWQNKGDKHWKAWRQLTTKPTTKPTTPTTTTKPTTTTTKPTTTICGAHISTEAISGVHARHNNKERILLKQITLKTDVVLENGKSPRKKLQPEQEKFRRRKSNLLRRNWIENHSISVGKENSPAGKSQIRRSRRIPAKIKKKETLMQVKSKIISKCEDGIKVVNVEGKGRGVVTTRAFSKGEYVVEYLGDLTRISDALRRERQYEADESIGCYMYYFNYDTTRYCVDATEETGHLGRLVNHSRVHPNLVTRIVPISGEPHLALEAKTDLEPGTELLLDYGDRSRQALENHPWLRL